MTAHAEIIPSIVDRIKRSLVGLKMPRAIEILDATVRRIERGEMNALEAIDALLTEELTLRENRRVKMALVMARLSAIKTLAGFDFSFQLSLDRNRIMALAELQFIDHAEVLHLIGPPGTGKSHLSLALGVEAVKAGRSVYFGTLADIIGALAKAEREGALREKIRFFCRFALLIVDEIGYLPVIPGGGNLFFQLVNARYEKGAMILTSNRGFSEWGHVFGDPVVATALLDRLLHHAIVIQIEGASYRLREHADLARHGCQLIVLIGQDLGNCAPRPGNAFGKGESTIEQQPANLTDDRRTVIDHPLPRPMQGLDVLLLNGLLRDERNVRLARCRADRFSVVAVVLLTPHEGLHILRADNLHLMPKSFELTRPIEGARTGFDDHSARIDLREDCEKLIAHHPAL